MQSRSTRRCNLVLREMQSRSTRDAIVFHVSSDSKQRPRLREIHAVRLRHRAMRDFAIEEVQSAKKIGIAFESAGDAVIRERLDVAIGHVRERLRGGARI